MRCLIPRQDRRREERRVDRRIQSKIRIAGVKTDNGFHRGVSDRRYCTPVSQLILDVAKQTLMARDHDFGRPATGLRSEQLELERQQCWIPFRRVYVGIDAL